MGWLVCPWFYLDIMLIMMRLMTLKYTQVIIVHIIISRQALLIE